MEVVRLLLCVLSVFVALVSERFVVLASFSQSLDSDFTFTLPAGRKECFYQTMKKDASLEIEYQVIKTLISDIILYDIVTLAEQIQSSYFCLQNHHLHTSNVIPVRPVIIPCITVNVFCILWFLLTDNNHETTYNSSSKKVRTLYKIKQKANIC